MFLKIVGIALLVFSLTSARAQGAPAGMWQFSIGGLSYHIPHNKPYNEVNNGLGVEYQWTDDTAVMGGVYRNSIGRYSKFLLAQYHPWEFAGVRFGATAGFIDGYPTAHNGNFTFVVLPSLSKQWKHVGVNAIVVPPLGKKEGIIFLQFKFPFDELRSFSR